MIRDSWKLIFSGLNKELSTGRGSVFKLPVIIVTSDLSASSFSPLIKCTILFWFIGCEQCCSFLTIGNATLYLYVKENIGLRGGSRFKHSKTWFQIKVRPVGKRFGWVWKPHILRVTRACGNQAYFKCRCTNFLSIFGVSDPQSLG